MKCEHCLLEWNSPQTIQVLFCPICQKPLINIQKHFNDFESILLYLTTTYGMEILLDKKNTLLFIENYLSEGKREYNFMNMIYATNIMNMLFNTRCMPNAEQKSVIRQAHNQLCSLYGVSVLWTEYIIGCICKCFGMINDLEHSIIKIKQMAELHDGEAQYDLAIRYYHGKNIEKNIKKYLYWLNISARNGYSQSMYRLGQELWNGINCEKNETEAIRLLSESVPLKNKDAVCYIASDNKISQLVNIDITCFVKELILLKEELSVQQLLNLSSYYVNCGNVKMAVNLARIAYGLDEKYAWESYVSVLKIEKNSENEVLIFKILKEAALNGNDNAAQMLGYECEKAAKTKNEMLMAIYWYQLAANAGNLNTQLHLAKIYEQGLGIERDLEKAIDWYRIAAYNGSDLAKRKVSFKSNECIIQNIVIEFEDDRESVCKVKMLLNFRENDYLIIEDPENHEDLVARYEENHSIEGFEIRGVDENTENLVLQVYRKLSI